MVFSSEQKINQSGWEGQRHLGKVHLQELSPGGERGMGLAKGSQFRQKAIQTKIQNHGMTLKSEEWC